MRLRSSCTTKTVNHSKIFRPAILSQQRLLPKLGYWSQRDFAAPALLRLPERKERDEAVFSAHLFCSRP